MLKAYDLSCGYVEKVEKNKVVIILWREHGIYHIRVHDFNKKIRLAWKTATNLTEARKMFKKMKEDFLK